MTAKTWTVDEIKNKILTSEVWLNRAIIAIYNLQTQHEQDSEVTTNRNNVGFSACDAHKMSYYAKWLLKDRKLTGKHADIAKMRMVKYTKQLTKIANKEI